MFNFQPFFILSNPRSGSSLLRVICVSHPNLAAAPECGFIEWWFEKYKDWSRRDCSSIRSKEFIEDLLTSRKFETWNFDAYMFRKLLQEREPEDYNELCSLVHISYGLQRNKKFKAWGDKNNYYIHNTNLLNQIFPAAKYIFIIRDGRDVASSYRGILHLKTNSPYVPKLPIGISEIAKEWTDNNNEVSGFIKSIDDSRSLVLRYEDLVVNLEEQCNRICRFLGVPFNEVMLKYYLINKKYQLEPKQTLDWKKKTMKSPDKLAIGKYKKELTLDEINIFNSIASETLLKFDYEL